MPDACDQGSDCASIGPAADGRVKPDLAHFYDCIDTVTCCGPNTCCEPDAYTSSFGGTSGATPITCGYFGLLFEMWHEGAFCGVGGGVVSVFETRPHMTTAKGLMINTAFRYPIGVGGQADITRDNQGWGMVDVKTLYDLREKLFVVDETDVLANLESKTYNVTVPANEPELRVTLVYADPPGTVSSTRHTINDLNLKVTSPSGTVYWGNCGLRAANWSSSTCSAPNPPDPADPGQTPVFDTVENVFLQNPEAGQWIISVSADEIVADGHTETQALDADFGLVVSGVQQPCCVDPGGCCLGNGACQLLDESCCINVGGTFLGTATTCQTLKGACCLANGACQLLPQTCCQNAGGNFLGAGTHCAGDCNGNGIDDTCDIASGTSDDCNGNGVPDECEVGSCCMPDGWCEDRTLDSCLNAGGQMVGCVQQCPLEIRQGACCLPGASCQTMVGSCCEGAGGTFNGPLTTCEPLAGCCLPNGTCIETIQSCCTEQGGFFDDPFLCNPPFFICYTEFGPQPGG